MFKSFTIKDLAYIILIAILTIVVLFRKAPVDPKSILRQHTIDSLVNDITKKESLLRYKDTVISIYNQRVNDLVKKVSNNDTKIHVINQYYDKKIRIVDSWDVDSIQQYLSTRYADSTK